MTSGDSHPKGHVWIAANTTWYIHNFRARLVSALIADGYLVTAFSPRDSYVERVTALGAKHVQMEVKNDSTNPIRELVTLVRIFRVLARSRPKLLLTYTPKVNIYCSLAARVLQIPVIANMSGLGTAFVRAGWVRVVSRALYKLSLGHASVLYFQNMEDLNDFVRRALVDPRKAKRIHGSGVDITRFSPQPRNTPTNEFRFLFTSRLLWDKGVAEFVEAARRLKEEFGHVRFRLLGFLDIANPSAVDRRVVHQWHENGVIEYLGASDDVLKQLADVDCVVLPSYYREGVPRSLLEAASVGLPVITTNLPGCRDVVDDGITGYLCIPKDVDDLVRQMKRMILLPESTRRAMGAAARKKITEQFDENDVIQEYLQAIRRVLAADGSTRDTQPSTR